MALFGKKKAALAIPDPDDAEEIPELEVGDEAPVELKLAELAPKEARSGGGMLGLVAGVVAVTAVAAIGGVVLGRTAAATIEANVAARVTTAIRPAEDHAVALKYSGDMVLQPIEAVITNLASPANIWVRLETAIVFKNGAIENPAVTAAELRQDMLAYLRTLPIGRLEGPSALQHLRDDLNERVALRTGGRVSELVLQSLVIQ